MRRGYPTTTALKTSSRSFSRTTQITDLAAMVGKRRSCATLGFMGSIELKSRASSSGQMRSTASHRASASKKARVRSCTTSSRECRKLSYGRSTSRFTARRSQYLASDASETCYKMTSWRTPTTGRRLSSESRKKSRNDDRSRSKVRAKTLHFNSRMDGAMYVFLYFSSMINYKSNLYL